MDDADRVARLFLANWWPLRAAARKLGVSASAVRMRVQRIHRRDSRNAAVIRAMENTGRERLLLELHDLSEIISG